MLPAEIVGAAGRRDPEMMHIIPVRQPDHRPMTDRDRQLVALRANSPMRPCDGRTADVDGLGLFDAVRQPPLL
jgi:hypothetical protein